MSKYYHLKVKEVVKETEDAVSIHFWHPWNEVIQYKPGQYLTVLWPVSEEEKVRRSYSLSSSPFTDISPAITVKKMADGLVSNKLVSDIKENDIIEVMRPAGTFFIDPDPDASRTVFLICTGSGITPLLSIAKSVLIAEPDSKVILCYGNRRQEDIIFRDTIDKLVAKYQERLTVIHSLTQPPENWQGETGRLTSEKLIKLLGVFHELIQKESTRFYLCGQNHFMEDARQALGVLGANNAAVLSESFLTIKEADFLDHVIEGDESENTSKSREIRLNYEGEEHVLTVAPHQSVLEAALENDIDLPYSCQAGMCTACLGRVLKGSVVLDEYDALTEAEVKQGFILTCVAHPQSDDVVIEVD